MAKKVLVVDDSAVVRHQVASALTEAGFIVIEAVDGMDGAEKIATTFDLALVISDMNMPRMNGIAMLEAVKQRGELPIIMLTTESDPQLVARGTEAGARGWIIKPFKADLLVAAAQRLAH
jgi:two-component system, chemotaxis family, chemotaxis protein CheY